MSASSAPRLQPVTAPIHEDLFALELVPRQCRLETYKPITVPSFAIKSEFIAYASPDSTYAVTKRLIDQAEKSILIGIYDFTAGHMKELILDAMGRGVKVSLMLDIDTAPEKRIFDELAAHGCECVAAPSCASDAVHYFSSSHEKVIVIDGVWSLVQSGNYSVNSIPMNEEDGGNGGRFRNGNRDMGVAVRDAKLAAFFTKVLRADMRLELDAERLEGAGLERAPGRGDILTEAPSLPPKRFRSKTFAPKTPVKVTPVLTPDNYMKLIPKLLRSAKTSIWIEQQYIRQRQPQVRELLDSIAAARKKNPELDVRVILARPIGPRAKFEQEMERIRELSEVGLQFGKQVRILNPQHFVHCHNKMIIVDGATALISSQNWSDSAVSKNREAGLLLEYPEMASYYGSIFQSDWKNAAVALPPRPELFFPEELNGGREMARLSLGDYAEV